MWGYSLEFWESVFFWATGVAAVAGAIGVTAAFIAGIVGYQVTDRLVKESDRKISEANARGEEAKAEAAKANLELERLRAPRSLSAEQQARMTEKLKVFQGTTFGIVTYSWEEEPATFKSILLGALVRAGWLVDINHGRDSLPKQLSPGTVVSLGTVTPPRIIDPAKALVESLTAEGFAARIDYGKVNQRSIDIEIQIGTKH